MTAKMIAQLGTEAERPPNPSDPVMAMAITRDPNDRKPVGPIRKNCLKRMRRVDKRSVQTLPPKNGE